MAIADQLILQSRMNLKGYSYTAELEKAAQHSRWSDHITENNVDAPKIKDDKDYPIEVNQFELKHSLTHLMEYSSTLYYLFASPDATQKKSKAEFALTLFSFKKSDGEYKKVQLKELKGTPSCIATSLLLSSEPSSRRKECKNEDDRTSRYKIVGLVGLKEGFIKVIEFSPSRSKNSKPTVSSHKLEQKEIVSILPGEHNFYDSKNICFILLEDSKVFIYNYLVKQVIAIYQPPILSHDFAVCMDIHCSGNYLATCTKSGQIFFWELNKMTFEAIQKSETRVPVKGAKDGAMEAEDCEINEGSAWAFTAKDRVISVFPMYALHSASINGLKWIGFQGNLLAMVSRTGLFRIISINFEMRDEFLNLIEYQIEKGESISSVQFFPQLQMLVVTKPREYVSLIEEEGSKGEEANLKWKESALKKNDYNSKMNLNCYGPGKEKECVIEKILFGNELRVERVQRFRVMEKEKRNLVDFTYSIISRQANFILAGNSKIFCIAPCDGLFTEEEK